MYDDFHAMPPSPAQSNIRPLPLEDLLLDPQNPRLPEGLPKKKDPIRAQKELLDYFMADGVLGELSASFADNGYFATEPLIATQEGAPKGRYFVLEGNRRLAALKAMLGHDDLADKLIDEPLTKEQRQRLDPVPVLLLASRDEATAMIGFRHIGGLKFWDSDAKARWIKQHVDALKGSKVEDPFSAIGRQVGLPVSAVRNAYLAWAVVDRVKRELGYDPAPLISQDRFGVWSRAVESPAIRTYTGISDARTYAEVTAALKRMDDARTAEVLADITPAPRGTGIVGDSRNITKYAQVIANDDARKVLRKTQDLGLAHEVLAPLTLLQHIRRATTSLKRLRDELDAIEEPDGEAVEAIRELQKIARGLQQPARADRS
jgi:hypothetical protein